MQYGEVQSEVAVSSYETSTCSTSVVVGLSKQIAEEIGCMNPDSMVPFTAGGNLQFTSNAVLPYLSAKGKQDLLKVAENRVVQVNSGFRTVAQQYLLYRWYQLGRCGIPAAATPGNSNHESGRALDLANWSQLVSAMENNGWSHSVPGDDVHFDHSASPDIRGRDVLAFQRLWNRNNPGDKITEDGDYGPQTESRLRKSPAEGFPEGACSTARAVDVVSVDGPDKVAPGARVSYLITLKNNGTTEWPAATKLLVKGDPSPLYDQQTWASPTEVGEIGQTVAPGGKATIELFVVAPMVAENTPVSTELELSDAGNMFGMITVSLTVTVNGDDGNSGDGDDANDGDVNGGCSAGGGAASWLLLGMPLLVVLRRRRR